MASAGTPPTYDELVAKLSKYEQCKETPSEEHAEAPTAEAPAPPALRRAETALGAPDERGVHYRYKRAAPVAVPASPPPAMYRRVGPAPLATVPHSSFAEKKASNRTVVDNALQWVTEANGSKWVTAECYQDQDGTRCVAIFKWKAAAQGVPY